MEAAEVVLPPLVNPDALPFLRCASFLFRNYDWEGRRWQSLAWPDREVRMVWSRESRSL